MSTKSPKNICDDQRAFNKAFHQAMIHHQQESKAKKTVGGILVLIFYLWALILALRVRDPEHRTLHIMFALLTGPIYVLSYYMSVWSK